MPDERWAAEFGRQQAKGLIVRSSATFKIGHFLERGKNSLHIAETIKDIKPDKSQPDKRYWDHWAITIAYYAMLYAAKAAILSKGYEVKDHYAAQVALGHLLVPDSITRADLALLEQAHRIFEDDYVKDFEEVRREGHAARYNATKTYTARQVITVYNKAQRFVAKIVMMMT